MIDIENLVFNTVFNAVSLVREDAHIGKGYVQTLSEFPYIAVHEVDNAPYQSTDTDDSAENYTRVIYQVDVYSDKAGTARSECKELIALVDGIMQSMKFRRQRLNEPVNIERTVFHQYARYSAIVKAGVTTPGNTEGETITTFQMYRR